MVEKKELSQIDASCKAAVEDLLLQQGVPLKRIGIIAASLRIAFNQDGQPKEDVDERIINFLVAKLTNPPNSAESVPN